MITTEQHLKRYPNARPATLIFLQKRAETTERLRLELEEQRRKRSKLRLRWPSWVWKW